MKTQILEYVPESSSKKQIAISGSFDSDPFAE